MSEVCDGCFLECEPPYPCGEELRLWATEERRRQMEQRRDGRSISNDPYMHTNGSTAEGVSYCHRQWCPHCGERVTPTLVRTEGMWASLRCPLCGCAFKVRGKVARH